MNSWHLSLTILAVCTVSPLATQQTIKITAEADIYMPGKSDKVTTVYFSQLPGSNQVNVTIKLSNLPYDDSFFLVTEKKPMENNCKGMGFIYSPGHANIIIGDSYRNESVFEKTFFDSVNLEGKKVIIGRGVAFIKPTDEIHFQNPFACGLIRNTTNYPETSITSTTTTPRTTSTPSTSNTTSTPRTTSKPSTTGTTTNTYTAQADINMPNGKVTTVYFSQLSGSNIVKVTMELYNLPAGENMFFVSENRPMGNDCNNLGSIYSLNNTLGIVGRINSKKETAYEETFEDTSVNLEDKNVIIGLGVAFFKATDNIYIESAFACGVILDTTKNPETRSNTIPRTTSTRKTTSTSRITNNLKTTSTRKITNTRRTICTTVPQPQYYINPTVCAPCYKPKVQIIYPQFHSNHPQHYPHPCTHSYPYPYSVFTDGMHDGVIIY